jgi:hypothetical protein
MTRGHEVQADERMAGAAVPRWKRRPPWSCLRGLRQVELFVGRTPPAHRWPHPLRVKHADLRLPIVEDPGPRGAARVTSSLSPPLFRRKGVTAWPFTPWSELESAGAAMAEASRRVRTPPPRVCGSRSMTSTRLLSGLPHRARGRRQRAVPRGDGHLPSCGDPATPERTCAGTCRLRHVRRLQ